MPALTSLMGRAQNRRSAAKAQMAQTFAAAREGCRWLRHCLRHWLHHCLHQCLLLVALSIPLLMPLLMPQQAAAAPGAALEPQTYRCQGDLLTAQLLRGPLDEPTIPDPSTAAVPVGGSVLLRWRQQTLQLPRTNNAGPASFTDGRWWWSLEDPAHPRFRQRLGLGQVLEIACEPAPR